MIVLNFVVQFVREKKTNNIKLTIFFPFFSHTYFFFLHVLLLLMDSIILFLYGLWLKYFNITKIRPIIFLSVSKTQALVPAVHPNNTSSQMSTLWNWNCYCFGHRSTVAVDAYSEHLRSIGIRSSYNVGA